MKGNKYMTDQNSQNGEKETSRRKKIRFRKHVNEEEALTRTYH